MCGSGRLPRFFSPSAADGCPCTMSIGKGKDLPIATSALSMSVPLTGAAFQLYVVNDVPSLHCVNDAVSALCNI